jgi:iron-sulfur cluster assembly accessory protein
MTDVMTHGVKLTETAVGKVKALLDSEGRDDLRLRVSVQPGGCSGLIYQLFFDEQLEEEDAVVDFAGVEVVVDMMSVPYLDGAEIDFEDTIQKAGLHDRQPKCLRDLAPAEIPSLKPLQMANLAGGCGVNLELSAAI